MGAGSEFRHSRLQVAHYVNRRYIQKPVSRPRFVVKSLLVLLKWKADHPHGSVRNEASRESKAACLCRQGTAAVAMRPPRVQIFRSRHGVRPLNHHHHGSEVRRVSRRCT
ncbi:hypothetical protein Mapa_005858 [Marchantia paleacea]|nr:hypothetical protein Mapa_005858 [Marchantia paleacea]